MTKAENATAEDTDNNDESTSSIQTAGGFYVNNQRGTYNSLTKDGLWVGGTDNNSGFRVDNEGNVTTDHKITANSLQIGGTNANAGFRVNNNGNVTTDGNVSLTNGKLQLINTTDPEVTDSLSAQGSLLHGESLDGNGQTINRYEVGGSGPNALTVQHYYTDANSGNRSVASLNVGQGGVSAMAADMTNSAVRSNLQIQPELVTLGTGYYGDRVKLRMDPLSAKLQADTNHQITVDTEKVWLTADANHQLVLDSDSLRTNTDIYAKKDNDHYAKVGAADVLVKDGSDAYSLKDTAKTVNTLNNAGVVGGTAADGTVKGVALGDSSHVQANEATAVGNGAYVGTGANNGTAVGHGAYVQDGIEKGTALGDSSQVTAYNAVALGAGSVADRANAVSIGAGGQERQLTNVAAGTQATDAVNKGQLDAVDTRVITNAADIGTLNTWTGKDAKLTNGAANLAAGINKNTADIQAAAATAAKHTTLTESASGNVVVKKTAVDGQLNYDVSLNPALKDITSITSKTTVSTAADGTKNAPAFTLSDDGLVIHAGSSSYSSVSYGFTKDGLAVTGPKGPGSGNAYSLTTKAETGVGTVAAEANTINLVAKDSTKVDGGEEVAASGAVVVGWNSKDGTLANNMTTDSRGTTFTAETPKTASTNTTAVVDQTTIKGNQISGFYGTRTAADITPDANGIKGKPQYSYQLGNTGTDTENTKVLDVIARTSAGSSQYGQLTVSDSEVVAQVRGGTGARLTINNDKTELVNGNNQFTMNNDGVALKAGDRNNSFLGTLNFTAAGAEFTNKENPYSAHEPEIDHGKTVIDGETLTLTPAEGTTTATISSAGATFAGTKEGAPYVKILGSDGTIQAKAAGTFTASTLAFTKDGLTVSGEGLGGNAEGSTVIKNDAITATDTFGNETKIDGGSITTENLTVKGDTNNKLTLGSTGLNINAGDTNANVSKTGVSLSVDNGAGVNSSVKLDKNQTTFSYTENGASAATTTAIQGQKITAGDVVINGDNAVGTIKAGDVTINDSGKITGLTAGTAATDAVNKSQLDAVGDKVTSKSD